MAEAKNDAMYYKQTFLFLMMELFRYRYRHDIQLLGHILDRGTGGKSCSLSDLPEPTKVCHRQIHSVRCCTLGILIVNPSLCTVQSWCRMPRTRIRNSACAMCTDQRKLQTIQQASLTEARLNPAACCGVLFRFPHVCGCATKAGS